MTAKWGCWKGLKGTNEYLKGLAGEMDQKGPCHGPCQLSPSSEAVEVMTNKTVDDKVGGGVGLAAIFWSDIGQVQIGIYKDSHPIL